MLSQEERKKIELFAVKIRMMTMETIGSLGVGHAGGALSVSDLTACLYEKLLRYRPKEPDWEGRDWLVVSKGHAGPCIYSALALKGFFPEEELHTLNRPGTHLPSHCDRNLTPGIDMTTGSLGQGASTAAGVALGFQMDHRKNRVYLILGDGESQEGQVWEMALFAAQRKLSNLTAFLDYNRLQLDGPLDGICSLESPADKFRAFGWRVEEADGHDPEAILEAVEKVQKDPERPGMVILHTVKARGWKKMENKTGSHCPKVSKEDLVEALSEMEEERKLLEAV